MLFPHILAFLKSGWGQQSMLDHKEDWAPRNWCFWIVMLKKTLESPLDSKEIKPVKPKENLPWIFTGRTDDETEAPILWPPDANSQVTGEDPDAGKNWVPEEKGKTEDKIVGWHHQLNGHEFEKTPGDSEGPGSVACCSLWGHESDMTEQLNKSNNPYFLKVIINLMMLFTFASVLKSSKFDN